MFFNLLSNFPMHTTMQTSQFIILQLLLFSFFLLKISFFITKGSPSEMTKNSQDFLMSFASLINLTLCLMRRSNFLNVSSILCSSSSFFICKIVIFAIRLIVLLTFLAIKIFFTVVDDDVIFLSKLEFKNNEYLLNIGEVS